MPGASSRGDEVFSVVFPTQLVADAHVTPHISPTIAIHTDAGVSAKDRKSAAVAIRIRVGDMLTGPIEGQQFFQEGMAAHPNYFSVLS